MDVIGMGGINRDILVRLPRFPSPDDEVAAYSVLERAGGSAANAVVGLSRLGVSTGYIGKVGNDSAGQFLISEFRKDNVDTSHVKIADGSSGQVIIMVGPEGQKMMICNTGVGGTISPEDVDAKYVEGAKLLHITSLVGPRVLEAVEKASQAARKAGVRVSVCPGPMFAELGLKKLERLLRNTDILFPSHLELQMLTGTDDPEKGAKKFLEFGIGTVVVTMGKQGCRVVTQKESFAVPSFHVKAIDTTGAGDAFCAGFIFSQLNGKGLRESARFANAVAGLMISHGLGAREGLPRLSEAEAFISKHAAQ
jgi:ribokinase